MTRGLLLALTILASPPLQAAESLSRTTVGRVAYAVVKDKDGKASLTAYAFMLTRVAFSLTDSPDRWPAICDQFWIWNDVDRRFELTANASANASGTPQCTFKGTVYFKGYLMPRFDLRPVITVAVEGAQGSVPIPVSVLLEGRTNLDWSGVPVFLGAISTTMLADGPQRLHVNAYYREIEIDANPATPGFEPGGDANITFVVKNGRKKK